MHRCRHLLAGLSHTEADAGLVNYVAMLVELGAGVEVRFVHVLPTRFGDTPAYSRDQVLREIEQQVQHLLAEAPEPVAMYCNVLKGPLMDRLLEFATEQQVDVILVGHQPNHSGRRALARRLAARAPCSVWMVPDRSPIQINRILVPLDFSEHAADALAVGTSLARLAGLSECLALHVYFNAAVATYEGYDQVIRGEELSAMKRLFSSVDCSDVVIRPLLREGANVAHVIGRVVEEEGVDLIVMGTRGRSRSSAVLLGSETEQTMMESRVPILAVKHYGPQLGLIRALLDKDVLLKGGPRYG